MFVSYNEIQCVEKDKKCEVYLNELKQAGSLFLICSMQFAVPVKFCINCVKDHTGTVDKYNELINAVYHNITANETEICKEKYFDQDRLNIVQTLYDEINGLWEKAYCNECFNEKIHNITENILNQLEVVNGCLQRKDPCFACHSLYLNLNDLYTRQLEQKYNNKVCFDIQDAMNRTRYLWSKKLHCCDRVVNLTAFAAVSSVIACLPILFYIIMYLYTKRVERNHDMLIDNSSAEVAENNYSSNNYPYPNIQQSHEINQVIPAQTNVTNRSSRTAPDNKDFKENVKDIVFDSDDDVSPSTSRAIVENKNSKIRNSYTNDSDDEPIIHGTPSETLPSSGTVKTTIASEEKKQTNKTQKHNSSNSSNFEQKDKNGKNDPLIKL